MLLTLPRQHLVKLYLYVLTALLLFAGHQVSRYTHTLIDIMSCSYPVICYSFCWFRWEVGKLCVMLYDDRFPVNWAFWSLCQGLRAQRTGVWPWRTCLPGTSLHEQIHHSTYRYVITHECMKTRVQYTWRGTNASYKQLKQAKWIHFISCFLSSTLPLFNLISLFPSPLWLPMHVHASLDQEWQRTSVTYSPAISTEVPICNRWLLYLSGRAAFCFHHGQYSYM